MAIQHRGFLVSALRRIVGISTLVLAGLLLFAPSLQAQVPGGMMNMSPEERAEETQTLTETLRGQTHADGTPVFTTATSLSHAG